MPSIISPFAAMPVPPIRPVAIAFASSMALSALIGARPARADEEAERSLLRRSYAEACGHYDERTNWTARQACNLAWFRAHEKAVWQHNLNPHGPTTGGPSS